MLLPMLFLAACADYTFTGKFKVPADDTAEDTPADDSAPTPGDDTAPPVDSAVDTGDSADTDTPPVRTDCHSILVYSTEADDSAGRNGGVFADLPDEPGLAAWDVDVRERADMGLLDEGMLEGRSQVWLMGTDADTRTTMDIDEVRALHDFVEAGGGLLVAGGPEGAERSYTEDVSGIAEPYGVELHDERSEGDDGAPVTPTSTTALLDGVGTLPGFSAVAELTLNDANVEVAAKTGGQAAIAWRQDVHVVFDRSWAGWSDDWRAVGDQATYILNVATFLEPCTE